MILFSNLALWVTSAYMEIATRNPEVSYQKNILTFNGQKHVPYKTCKSISRLPYHRSLEV
jgi:hypothetical protein